MKILYAFLFLTGFGLQLQAQVNLVSNGSFEEHTSCPYVNGADPGGVVAWSIPPEGWTPDYFHPCAAYESYMTPANAIGFQQPNDGEAYMGFFAFHCNTGNWWPGGEAYYNQLAQPLQAGKTYVFRAHVSLADSVDYAVSGLGFLVSEQPANSQSPWYSLEPTYSDTIGFFANKTDWELICDTFVAFGGEQYLTIGNFEVDELADTLYVGGGWINGSNACNAYYYLDDVSVIPLDSHLSAESLELLEIGVNPNPSNSLVRINNKSTLQPKTISIYSVEGRLVKSEPWKTEVDVSRLSEGMYILKVAFENGAFGAERLIIHR